MEQVVVGILVALVSLVLLICVFAGRHGANRQR